MMEYYGIVPTLAPPADVKSKLAKYVYYVTTAAKMAARPFGRGAAKRAGARAGAAGAFVMGVCMQARGALRLAPSAAVLCRLMASSISSITSVLLVFY